MIMAKDSNNNYVKIEDIKQQNSFNGISPIEFKGSGENLENYRIYGNTVDGESVGDRTGNLFDGELAQGYYSDTAGSSNDLISSTMRVAGTSFIPVSAGSTMALTYESTIGITKYLIYYYNNDKELINVVGWYISGSTFTIPNNISFIRIVWGAKEDWAVGSYVTLHVTNISNIMLNLGSTALPYEPYGYKVPVTVEGINILPMSTTPISTDVDDFHCEYDGAGAITLTTDKDNAVLSSFSIPLSEDFIIPVSVGQGGDGCVQFNNSIATSANTNTDHISVNFYYNMTFIDSWGLTTINRIQSTYSSMGGKTINRVIIDIKGTGFSTNRKIVLRPAFVLNTTEQVPFEPYHAPVTTPIYLPEQIKKVGDEAEYVDYYSQTLHRVRKNLLQNTATSQTINGVTFTVNDDRSVTCNGTAMNVTFFTILMTINQGSYVVSGAPAGCNLETPYITIRLRTTYGGGDVPPFNNNDFGGGVVISSNKNDNNDYLYKIRVPEGYTCDNLTFYPMIRKADISDDTYEPYISDTELDVTLPELPTSSNTNILSVETSIKPSKVWGRLSEPKDILYIKDNLGNILFSKYHEIEDEPPLTYKAKKAGTLTDYRIYGNTVGGESVGDLVESGEHAGEYKVPVIISRKAKHTATLQLHDCLPSTMQFDAPEALYYAENGLMAGTYCFTIQNYDTAYGGGKTYNFTLTHNVPVGGQLTFGWKLQTQATDAKISSYANSTSTTAIETVSVTEGSSGTNLGTTNGISTNVNHIQRVRYGSNNYEKSAIRQFLNSSDDLGYVWSPKTKYDRPPSWNKRTAGFMKDIDSDFLAAVGISHKDTALNSIADGGGSVTLDDKFFLLSRSEVYGSLENNINEGSPYSYYSDYSDLSVEGTGNDTNRIKYINSSAKIWWLRSPYFNSLDISRYINETGSIVNNYVNLNVGVAPACNIELDDNYAYKGQVLHVRDQISVTKGNTTLVFDVIGIDHDDVDFYVTTTNLYLPEPIKMVGDEAEYIDYGEQKMHRIGADDIDVTLPALPTLPGTNVLSVRTAVQPSRVEVKGRIKAVGQETEPEPETAEAEQE